MKTLRRECAAAILMLALAVSVLGGEIDCPGAPSPTPPPPQSATTTIILTIVDLIH